MHRHSLNTRQLTSARVWARLGRSRRIRASLIVRGVTWVDVAASRGRPVSGSGHVGRSFGALTIRPLVATATAVILVVAAVFVSVGPLLSEAVADAGLKAGLDSAPTSDVGLRALQPGGRCAEPSGAVCAGRKPARGAVGRQATGGGAGSSPRERAFGPSRRRAHRPARLGDRTEDDEPRPGASRRSGVAALVATHDVLLSDYGLSRAPPQRRPIAANLKAPGARFGKRAALLDPRLHGDLFFVAASHRKENEAHPRQSRENEREDGGRQTGEGQCDLRHLAYHPGGHLNSAH